jgi:signal transduction histidine kinase
MASASASRRRRGAAIDVAVAVVVFALTLALIAAISHDATDDHRSLDALGVLLAAFASLPLVYSRRAPLGVFAVTTTASATLNLVGYPPGPPLGPTIALFFLGLYPAATRAGRGLTAVTVIGLFAVHIAATWVGEGEFPVIAPLFGTILWGGAWVIGDRVRMRRERAAELEQEAERELRLAVAEERTRIARDLHDSAGHAINVILVQAGAARILGESNPERARAAIETIEDVARETVGEIDRLVRGLREDGAEQAVHPPVGLAALDTLVERHRAAGLDVTVDVRGDARALAPAVDQAAYRILQEALTNAGRHGGSRASVEVVYGPGAFALTVSNPVRLHAPESPPGHGIVGMQERAHLLGGGFEAGRTGATFRVRAKLPYGDRP